MRKQPIFKTELGLWDEHPAICAWNQLTGDNTKPSSVEKLMGLSWDKSVIYRLNNVGQGGVSVIAKRAHRTSLLVEKSIYEIILPNVPVRSLHFHGFVQEEKGDFCWLFLEEALGVPYSESIDHHRALASRWLGMMHTTTAHMKLDTIFPRTGTERHLLLLGWAYERIINHLTHPRLTTSNCDKLKEILNHLGIIKKHWGEVNHFFDMMSSCLVHGDFISKNVRVCKKNAEPILYVMDWEYASWGIPAVDIGGLDLDVYWSIIKDANFILTREELLRLSNLGLVIRYISWIQATSTGLKYESIENTMHDLSYYEEELAHACHAMGWD